MILLATPRQARLLLPGAGWAYLGRDLAARARLESRLGPFVPVGPVARAQAWRLRRPFLDLVARLGRGQDPARWWAGTLAWRDPGTSDLFQLCVWQATALELAASGRDLTLVVEDPWLFHQLRAALPEARCSEEPSLALPRLRAFLLGWARRRKWELRMLRSRLRYALAGASPVLPAPPAAAIYSPVLARSVAAPGRFADHYLPGLEEELAAAGLAAHRFVDPETTGFEAALAALPGVTPLILHATLADLWSAALARPPRPAREELDGRPIDLLLEREYWHDLSRAGRCAFELFRRCAARFLSAAPWRAVVYPWENQPQERMLALEAGRLGVRRVGVQHTTLPRLQLAFFALEREAPGPDALIAAGPEPLRLLKEEGALCELALGGARRFPKTVPTPGSSPDVLVVLPIDRAHAEDLLEAVGRAYPGGGEGFTLRVKPHPAQPWALRDPGFPAVVDEAPMAEALSRCSIVLFTGSTAGLEALAAGRKVLRYRPETVVDMDPCDFLDEAALPSCDRSDLRAKLEGLRPAGAAATAALASLFAPVDAAVWRAVILGKEPVAP